MLLILLSALPFIGAVLVASMTRSSRTGHAMMAASVTTAALLLLLSQAPAVLWSGPVTSQMEWIPSLGLSFSLFLDGLGLLFAVLILGIGLLIIIYARFYLAATDPMGRFYVFLLLFQGAMLGVALCDNVLLLLIFWELTSISSFLLIGFWNERAEARQGARMALAVTGGGGLALIAGMLILGQISGTYELTAILRSGDMIRASPYYPLALVLILIGCFTKSAQFPFHFWLPHAMSAPTPVSAYLHSATMVKAGVFLIARLWPVLAGTDLWFYLVATTGLLTMLIGAAIALFKHDLKAILAYSTVSHLGLLTMLFGFGTPMAAVVGVFHFLNHAIFKAALFMNAGIIDHETGTRDARILGGLMSLMPITGTIGLIAAASMAGLPPLNGFLSKEMMLDEAAHTTWGGVSWLIPLVVTLAATLSVAYSLRYAVHVYLGARRGETPRPPHDPPLGLWGPSALLAIAAVAIGLFPMLIAGALVHAAAGSVTGGTPPTFTLKLWHGVTPALAMSGIAIIVGALALNRFVSLLQLWNRLPVPDAKSLFDGSVTVLVNASRRITVAVHKYSLQHYLTILFAVAILLGVEGLWVGGYGSGTRPTLPAAPVAVIGWIALVAATLAVVRSHRQRFLALVFISVIGLIVALGFIYLSAPDLALTQISVEVVTILLLLLALNLLPKKPDRLGSTALRLRDAMLGLAGGCCTGFVAWAIMTRVPNNPISDYHWANSYSGGGGTNVVNVTLVDFRALDTFGEIIVLGIAALAIFALLQTAVRGASGQRLRQWIPDLVRSPEHHPMMFVVATRLLLPLAMLVGIYIFLRGHNQPGGGFIAGLVISIAILMQYMASGFDWTDQRRRIDEHALIACGVLIAALTGLGALLFGKPLFTSAFGYVNLPIIGTFELATAMLFDVGVALAVIGAVMLALAELSQIAQRAEKDVRTEYAMDVDPGRKPEEPA